MTFAKLIKKEIVYYTIVTNGNEVMNSSISAQLQQYICTLHILRIYVSVSQDGERGMNVMILPSRYMAVYVSRQYVPLKQVPNFPIIHEHTF
jgi:hypothetical protein